MARRKRLLSVVLLNKGNELLDLSVPMTKVHIALELENHWSCQSTADIFAADREGFHAVTRPDWLQEISEKEPSIMLHDSPTDWQFEGTFPYGEWVNTANKVA